MTPLVVEVAKLSMVKTQAERLAFDLTKLTETREEQWRFPGVQNDYIVAKPVDDFRKITF